jgi:Ca2+-binding EF-hand superfamily protein
MQELKGALSASGDRFDDATIDMMVKMFDHDDDANIDLNEFTFMFRYIRSMRESFDSVATGASEVNLAQTQEALRRAKYHFRDRHTFEKLIRRFDPTRSGRLNFERYLQLCVFLGTVRAGFQRYQRLGSEDVRSQINIRLDDFIQLLNEVI